MKWTVCLAALLLGCSVFCEEAKAPAITTPKGWSTNIGDALKKAGANPKLAVGLLFGGTDQAKLQKDVLSSGAFNRLSREKLALAYVPIPKPAPKPEAGPDGKPKPVKPDPAAVTRQKYKVNSKTCVLVLLNAKGKEYGRLTKIEPAPDYCARIRKTLVPVPEVIKLARSRNVKKLEEYLSDAPSDANVTDAFGNSLVMEAVKQNNLAMLKMLFTFNAKPDMKGDGGLTALILWCQREQTKTEIGDLLLARGANINNSDSENRTALYFAVQAKAVKTCQWLIKNKANPNNRDKQWKTPLMLAVTAKNITLVKLLCEQGRARVGAQDKQGNTALHLAAQSGNAEIVRYLLQRRAVKKTRNNQKKMPYDLAKDAKVKALLK